MIYIYERNIETGRENHVNAVKTWEEAIAIIYIEYDRDQAYPTRKNKYYYFAKVH